MGTHVLIAAMAGTLLGTAATQEPERPPLALTVTPSVCFSPCTVRVEAMVEPHADNRRLTLVADGPHFRSSSVQLEGADAPRAHEMRFEHLETGRYLVQVRLERAGGGTRWREIAVEVKGERDGPSQSPGSRLATQP
jgi:hypothetical protein